MLILVKTLSDKNYKTDEDKSQCNILLLKYTFFDLIVIFFPADIDWMTAIQKENISHMLASMHLVLRQQDGQEKDAGEYCHITNTSYEKFVERSVSQQSMGVHLSKRSDFKY